VIATVTVPVDGSTAHTTLNVPSRALRGAHIAKGGLTDLGRMSFPNLRAGAQRLTLPLNATGRRSLRKLHRLTVTVHLALIQPQNGGGAFVAFGTAKARLRC
jgi:hypothetical protein